MNASATRWRTVKGRVTVTFSLRMVRCGFPGRGPADEDAEHGAVPPGGDGHGPPHGQAKPEQLEPPLSLVAVATTLRHGP